MLFVVVFSLQLQLPPHFTPEFVNNKAERFRWLCYADDLNGCAFKARDGLVAVSLCANYFCSIAVLQLKCSVPVALVTWKHVGTKVVVRKIVMIFPSSEN